MKNKIDIYDGDNENRYILGVDGNNPLYVIAMNPSMATDEIFDQTVVKCFGVSALLGFDGCIMFNLIPYRESKSEKLPSELSNDLLDKNINIICERIPQKSIILATWGEEVIKNTPLNYSLKEIYKRLKEKKCNWKYLTYLSKKRGDDLSEVNPIGLTSEGHPRHASHLNLTSLLEDFNIDEYMKDKII